MRVHLWPLEEDCDDAPAIGELLDRGRVPWRVEDAEMQRAEDGLTVALHAGSVSTIERVAPPRRRGVW
jgi:hypothetical protein